MARAGIYKSEVLRARDGVISVFWQKQKVLNKITSKSTT